jgi:hypothetical protein
MGDPGSDHRLALDASLDSVEVSGKTPTCVAYTVGLEALQSATHPGNEYLVLLTDGEPTYGVGCVGDGTTLPSNRDPAYLSDTQAAIGAAFLNNIPPVGTFVVGLPGSEPLFGGADAHPWLSGAARSGGTNPIGCSDEGPDYCHFDLSDPEGDFAASLDATLARIVGAVVPCQYSPPIPPAGQQLDPERMGVRYIDGSGAEFAVPLVAGEFCIGGSQGWIWTSSGAIELCASTCALVRGDAQSGIELVYSCDPVPF